MRKKVIKRALNIGPIIPLAVVIADKNSAWSKFWPPYSQILRNSGVVMRCINVENIRLDTAHLKYHGSIHRIKRQRHHEIFKALMKYVRNKCSEK